MEDYAIEIDHVTIRFNMASEKVDNLKEYIIKLIKKELIFLVKKFNEENDHIEVVAKYNLSLSDYLNEQVFADAKAETMEPDAKDVEGFNAFMTSYINGLAAERGAVEGRF